MHFPQADEVRFLGGWAIALIPMCLFWGGSLFLFAEWTQWFRAPKWMAATFGGLLCGAFTILAIDSWGWYIAIAPFLVYASGLAGALFGSFALPRLAIETGPEMKLWKRVLAIAIAVLSFSAVIARPLISG